MEGRGGREGAGEGINSGRAQKARLAVRECSFGCADRGELYSPRFDVGGLGHSRWTTPPREVGATIMPSFAAQNLFLLQLSCSCQVDDARGSGRNIKCIIHEGPLSLQS